MYAIIRAGGKQYKVQPGDVVKVEKLKNELGEELEVTEVLAIGGDKTYLGEPLVKDAKVNVVVTNQDRAPKVIVFKKKRRQGYRRMQGHRQLYTELFVKSIVSPEGQVAETDKKAQVFDPMKKIERLEQIEAERIEAAEAKKAGEKKPAKKKAAKKKTAAKKTAKKKTAKKAAAKKKTAKKKTAAKKTTTKKKTAKKKTTKKS